jgi:acyl-coenzyme A thioesterase PaaI-like protein
MLQKVKEIWEQELEPRIPARLAATAMLRGFGLLKVPMLFYVRPTVVEISPQKAVIEIALNRRSKNHLNSMYFGAMAVGADAVIGLLALHQMKQMKAKRVQLVFKNFKIDFLKRPEGNVHFVCDEGARIGQQIQAAMTSGERVSEEINGYAIVPSISTTDPVAKFSLGLSLKQK